MAQYSLDLAAAQSMSDAAVQSILNTLNPHLGALSDSQLANFEAQLAAIGTSGVVSLQNVKIDAADSTSVQTVYDLKYTAGHGIGVQAGDGFDTISASGGDTVYGSSSAEGAANIASVSGDNLLVGGSGSDTLYGGTGDDTLYGGTGRSTLYAGYGHDTMYGGAGPMSKTTFVVTSDTFNDDVIKGSSTGGASVLDLADLNQSNVSIKTNASTGVTTVSYGGQSLSLSKVGEIDFANGQHLKL
ncbi:MAG TPA: hypothetical protein VEH77_09030 [Roseiarcus sp.]|nr:hypothetical protein [Roseiarcus sp.]